MSYSLRQFSAEIEAIGRRHPEWRKGQTAYNVLDQRRPDIAAVLRGTAADHFHQTHLTPEFWAEVRRLWGNNPRAQQD